MKKVGLISVALASLLFAGEMDFKKGFETAVEAVRLELINGSNFNRDLNYKSKYLLYTNTEKLSTNEILLAQFIAFANGFTDLGYSDEKLYFGSYNRQADQEQAKDKLERILGLKIQKEKNNDKVKTVTPILDRSFYIQKRNIVEGAIKRSEYLTEQNEAIVTIGTPIITEKKNPVITEKEPFKNIYFLPTKNKTDVFVIDGEKMKKVGITDMSRIKYSTTITVNKEEFVKAYNYDYYLKKSEVKFIK
ncbi:hypothetical protein [Campylobacter sp. CCUG 57310]|uniref:hypothetical protein n=1 Tax=Campylobacter sp. CCUG 57310 TaxID=2517362 RepID=UPI0015639468|nr:hypothetical protein [Campylobacter sp. CCUG 57310]QKF93223.1 hypothetical protein CORI_a037 [Campylobacter sp. CCUG 57310]